MENTQIIEGLVSKLTAQTLLPLSGKLGSISELVEQLSYCAAVRATIGSIQIESLKQAKCNSCEELHVFLNIKLSSDILKSTYETSFMDLSTVCWDLVLPPFKNQVMQELNDDAKIFLSKGEPVLKFNFDKNLADELINLLTDLTKDNELPIVTH
jgi:hypothetical protein